ncbi:hypothetical protein Tco_0694543 [Tanacetum coccineum]
MQLIHKEKDGYCVIKRKLEFVECIGKLNCKIHDEMNLTIRNWKHIICTWHIFKRLLQMLLTFLDPSLILSMPKDDADELAQERDLLASLIDKLKCEIDDNKNRNKFLESSHKALVDKLKDLKKFQSELDKYHDVNYASKVAIDYMKKELFAHQETISIMSQEKEAQIKFYKTREDKELDKVIALENKVKVLDDIVYKTGQSIQTMNMLNRNYKTSFAKPEFLKKAQRANPRLYDIGCYNDNLALMLAPESDETIRLDKESRSKLSDLIRPFDYDQLNNLYDLFVPQREKSPEQHYFSTTLKMSHTSAKCKSSKEWTNG